MSVPFELRDYQQQQLDALYDWWSRNDAIEEPPIIVAPTGSGKSFTIAMIVDRLFSTWPEHRPRTVVLVPSRELAQQNAEKLVTVLPPHITIGYYSSSLGKKNPHADVIVATVGSIYRDAHILGDIRCVIADECHLINPAGDGMYRRFLRDLAEHTRFAVVGLTATPFRGNGVWLTQGADPLFAGVCHETRIPDMVAKGYLSPLALPEEGIETQVDTQGVTVTSTGDYALAELEDAVTAVVGSVARESVQLASERRKVIAFTPTVAVAERLAEALTDEGWTAEVVCGATPKDTRIERIRRFRDGELRCLVTVLALATGFDVPDIDAIIWARPCRSPVLYVQGAGRGLRTAPGKADCLWMDFTDTTERLGPLDEVKGRDKPKPTGQEAPFAVCPECHAKVVPASLETCPVCGETLREKQLNISESASDAPVLGSQRTVRIEEYRVSKVAYYRHRKEGSPDSLRVAYCDDLLGINTVAQEWVFPLHGGWAASKASSWLGRRATDRNILLSALQAPDVIEAILWMGANGYLRQAARIRVNESGRFPEVVAHEFDEEKAA